MTKLRVQISEDCEDKKGKIFLDVTTSKIQKKTYSCEITRHASKHVICDKHASDFR